MVLKYNSTNSNMLDLYRMVTDFVTIWMQQITNARNCGKKNLNAKYLLIVLVC